MSPALPPSRSHEKIHDRNEAAVNGPDLPFMTNPSNGRFRAGFSDATGVMFELRGALPGVGEALKREIAGLVLVDRLWLWGFGRLACLESGLTDPLTVVCWAKRCAGFAGIWPMNVVPCRCYPFLRR